jgi:hypothetical protein
MRIKRRFYGRRVDSAKTRNEFPRAPFRFMRAVMPAAHRCLASGRCTRCGASGPARDTVVAPGPGLDSPGLERAEPAQDAVSKALTRPHRLLEPLRHA